MIKSLILTVTKGVAVCLIFCTCAFSMQPVLEYCKKVKSAEGIMFQKWENGRCVYQIGYVNFHFTSRIDVIKK